jgi:hypothetical protein
MHRLYLVEHSANISCGPISPALVTPSPIASHLSHFEERSLLPTLTNKQEIHTEGMGVSSIDMAEDMESVLARLSLYASLVFPFSLEDSVSWDDATVTEPLLSCRAIDSVELDSVVVPLSAAQEFCTEVPTPSDPPEVVSKRPDTEILSSPLATVDRPLSDRLSEGSATHTTSRVFVSDVMTPVSSDATICGLVNARTEALCTESSTVSASRASQSSVLASDSDVGTSSMLGDTYRTVLQSSFDHSSSTCKNGLFCKDTAWNCSETPATSSTHSGFSLHESGSLSLPVDPSLVSSTAVGSSSIQDDILQGISEEANGSEPESVSITVRRARRAGIYGSLPPPLVAAPQSISIAKPTIPSVAAEKGRSSIAYFPRRDSKSGSVLRPLVLPMCLTARESSLNGADGPGIPSDVSQQSIRRSIGLPPPFPLPDVPLSSSSSFSSLSATASALTPRTAVVDKGFDDLLSKPDALTTPVLESESVFSTLTLTPPLLTPSNAIEAPDGFSVPNLSVNWGIAF